MYLRRGKLENEEVGAKRINHGAYFDQQWWKIERNERQKVNGRRGPVLTSLNGLDALFIECRALVCQLEEM